MSEGRIGVLASYAVDGKSNAAATRAQTLIDRGVPFVWDSGAWSVFTGAAIVSVEEHTEWVRSKSEAPNPDVRFVGLDVIGNAAGTLDNYRAQRAAGVPVEPTLHYGDDPGQVADLLAVADTEWFNIGGVVGAMSRPNEHRNVAAFVATVKKRLPPEVKVHVLGCTPPSIARLIHYDATDSTYWLSMARFRTLSLFDDRRGDWRKFSACTTTRDDRRNHTWQTAYKNAGWLRQAYGIEPEDIAVTADDDKLTHAAIESHRRFAGWAARLHDAPVTVYLAGAVSSKHAHEQLLKEPPG